MRIRAKRELFQLSGAFAYCKVFFVEVLMVFQFHGIKNRNKVYQNKYKVKLLSSIWQTI